MRSLIIGLSLVILMVPGALAIDLYKVFQVSSGLLQIQKSREVMKNDSFQYIKVGSNLSCDPDVKIDLTKEDTKAILDSLEIKYNQVLKDQVDP